MKQKVINISHKELKKLIKDAIKKELEKKLSIHVAIELRRREAERIRYANSRVGKEERYHAALKRLETYFL